jgi:hypothetical protein
VHPEGKPVEGFEHGLLGGRQVEAELRPLVQPAAEVDGLAQALPGLVDHPLQLGIHGG